MASGNQLSSSLQQLQPPPVSVTETNAQETLRLNTQAGFSVDEDPFMNLNCSIEDDETGIDDD